MSSQITFGRVSAHEARIYQDGDHVGDLYHQTDILDPASSYFVIHLDEDSRGPVRVHERSRVRAVAQSLVDSHPLWS